MFGEESRSSLAEEEHGEVCVVVLHCYIPQTIRELWMSGGKKITASANQIVIVPAFWSMIMMIGGKAVLISKIQG